MVLAGHAAILPCHFSTGDDHQFVEWSKTDLKPDVVLLYRDGKEEHAQKNKDFIYRTSLVEPDLGSSDRSLRISEVRLSDEGTYTCKTSVNDKVRVVATLGLSVGKFVGALEVELMSTGCLVLSRLVSVQLSVVPLQLSLSTFGVVLTNSHIVRSA